MKPRMMRICSCTGNSWHSGCQYVYSGARLCLLNTADKNYRISLYIIYWSIRNGILVLQFWTAFFSSIRRFESTNQVLTPWGYSSFHSQVADSGSLWYTTSCIYRKEGRAWPQILPVDDCRQKRIFVQSAFASSMIQICVRGVIKPSLMRSYWVNMSFRFI